MARLFPAVGELSYNGVTFPGPLRASIESTPMYDESDRTVKYVKYVLRVETYFCHDDTALVPTAPVVAGADPHVNNILDHIRSRLMAAGMPLRIKEKGFGLDVYINATPTAGRMAGTIVFDSEFGPKPRVLSWQPVGDNRTAKVTWEIEFDIPECAQYGKGHGLEQFGYGSAQGQNPFAPIERTYSIDWSIGEDGLTVRTIDGQLQVHIPRHPLAGGLYTFTNADDFRHHCDFPIPLGFMRSQKYQLSSDRRTLSFSLVDRELESDYAFYPGTLHMESDHQISSLFQDAQYGGFVKWDCTIRCSVTLPKNQSTSKGIRAQGWSGAGGNAIHGRRLAWAAFKEILDVKIWMNARKGGAAGPGILSIPGQMSNVSSVKGVKRKISAGGAMFLPDKISMKESLFGRRFDFEFSYNVFCMPDRVFESTKIMDGAGPNNRTAPATFRAYLDYVGGRDGKGIIGVGNIQSKPFNRRGELGGQEAAGREASYFGSVPGFRDPVWEKDIIYDYCYPTMQPYAKWKIPPRVYYRQDGHPKGVSPGEVTPGMGDDQGEGETGSIHWPNDGKGETGGDQKMLGYACNFTHEEQGQTLSHSRLGKSAGYYYHRDNLTDVDTSEERYRAVDANGEIHIGDRPKLQTIGPTTHMVRVTGYAYQMGYTRLPPATIQWGKDCTLYRVSKRTTVSQVARGALPVYLTQWDILYHCDNSPNGEPFLEAETNQHTSGIMSNQST